MSVGRKKHIGRLLETARKIRGLTADLVALNCNVTRGRVYQWEKQTFVMSKNLPALAATLQVPLHMLIAENGKRPLKKSQLSKIKHFCVPTPAQTCPVPVFAFEHSRSKFFRTLAPREYVETMTGANLYSAMSVR